MNFPIIELRPDNKEYPKLLKQISDPPNKFYCRGNIKLLNSFCFAVVGTRKMTAYGKEATEYIVSGLASSGVTIVSGLAMGIDAVAHQTALDNDLPTIAVLGSTVDDAGIGPRVNFFLAQEILKNGGLLISEYKKRSEVFSSNFAVRDRITSGLSKGVLVIEAPEKSGALITTKFATEQNRDVFAVPGNIFSPNSKGPNMLIKGGAKPVFSADDILGSYYQNLEFKLESKKNISTPRSESSDILEGVAEPLSELLLRGTKDPVQKKILAILDEKGELSIDELMRESATEVSQILSALSLLEIKGKIKQRSGKYTCS